MGNYCDIAVAWYDVPMTLSDELSQTIYETVKHLQPDCPISSRLGVGRYD